nr:PEPxxWA-CTERM sorting domain-containing protein [Parafrankia sp. BMG5.11]
MNAKLLTAAACAAIAFAVPAGAAPPLCSSGPGINLTTDPCIASGNDNLASVEAAIAAATGIDVSLLNLTLYGKSDDNPGLFSFSPNANPTDGKETTFTVLDGTLISYVSLKAGTDFKVYQLPTATSISSLGILVGKGNQPDISHLSFWTTPNAPAVPEPATWAMMLFGFGAVGYGMRRRRSESNGKLRVRFAV